MKKIAIIIALLLFQTQVMTMAAANYDKNRQKSCFNSDSKCSKPADTDSTYLLKYNIDDLEAAPWLNNGKRTYKK